MKTTSFVAVAESLIKDAATRIQLGENAPSLMRDYRQRLNCYCRPFFGELPVSKVDSKKLREFRQVLAEKGLKNSTIKPIMSFTSKVLKLAIDDHLIAVMPNVPSKGHSDAPRPAFSRRDYAAILKTLKRAESGKPPVAFKTTKLDWELRAMVTFMVNSFFRPGDLFALKNSHVAIIPPDVDGYGYLRLTPPASKSHDDQIISMPVAVKIYERTLRNHLKSGFGKPDDYVFMPGRKNRRYAAEIVRRLFGQVLDLAGLRKSAKGVPHTMYSLRHTAIVFRLLHSEGLDVVTLARNCRTSVEMIDRFYARSLTPEMNRQKLHSFRRPTRYLV